MAIFVVTYTHPDGDGWVRHLQEHVGFLMELLHEEVLRASGPLVGTPRQSAMLILSAPSREAVLELIERDPLKVHGQVTEVSVVEWDPIFGAFQEDSSAGEEGPGRSLQPVTDGCGVASGQRHRSPGKENGAKTRFWRRRRGWHGGHNEGKAEQARWPLRSEPAMNRIVAAVAVSLSLAFSSALALAAPQHDHAARHQGDKAQQFPMAAEAFREHVTARIGKARERMEEHLTKKSVPGDKAREIRARFDLGVARLNEKVNEVCADGTVTKEEAQEVHALVKQMLHHHKEQGHKAQGRQTARLVGCSSCG
jgi:hypothetical protein